MSRSKKNWDELVGANGSYRTLIGKEGPKGAIGPKGSIGEKGQKGGAGGLFRFRGFVATQADLDLDVTLPRETGDVWKAEDDKKFYVRTQASAWGELGQLGSVLIGPKGAVGPKGNRGAKGDKGQKGQTGEKGAKGNTGSKGQKGQKGVEGQKGQKGVGDKGQKGTTGEVGPKGEVGDKGLQGSKGTKGDHEKGQKGDHFAFADLTDEQKREIQGEKGQKGNAGAAGADGADIKGQKGENGFGVRLKGSVPTVDDLPDTDLTEGDLYIIEADYHAYVWDGEGWNDIGAFQGPQGQKGDVGPEGPKGDVGSSTVPVGSIMPYAGESAPTGWLLCDGGAIPGAYTQLKAIVGNNVPNLKGKFLGGYGANGLNTLRAAYNDATRKPRNSSFLLDSENNSNHSHTFRVKTDTDTNGNHQHQIGNTGTVSGSSSAGRFYPSTTGSVKTSTNGDHKHSIDFSGTTSVGGSHTHAITSKNWDSYTRPHTYVVNYIIKHD